MPAPRYRDCVGHDRCAGCCKFKLVWIYYEKAVDEKLAELYPDGRPDYWCEECITKLEGGSWATTILPTSGI